MTDIPDDVRAWLVRLDLRSAAHDQLIDELRNALDDATATDDLPHTAPVGWQYTNVCDWVEQHFVRLFARDEFVVRWCPHWWDHVEAIVILTAMWRTWETARKDRTRGIAQWLTGFAYPLLRELCDEGGTFRNCSADKHESPGALPFVSPPADRRLRMEVT